MDYEAVFSDSTDVNDMLNKFYDSLYGIIDKHVSKASLRANNHPPWFNKELINLKNVRNREYKKLCSTRVKNPDTEDSKFGQVNEEFEIAHKIAHEAYIKDLGENFKSNPKNFWSHVNGKRKSNTLPCKMSFNGKFATPDQEKVYIERQKDDDLDRFLENCDDRNCLNVRTSLEAVRNVLSSMELNKGQGPDKLPPVFLRECADEFQPLP